MASQRGVDLPREIDERLLVGLPAGGERDMAEAGHGLGDVGGSELGADEAAQCFGSGIGWPAAGTMKA
jgi:hypothetical protein